MQLLHSVPVWRLFRNVRLFTVLLVQFSCPVPGEYFPFAMQGRRGLSLVSGRRTTSAGTQQMSRVHFFPPRRRHTAKHRSLYRSSKVPILSKFMSFFGSSCRSIRVSVASGYAAKSVASILLKRSSKVSTSAFTAPGPATVRENMRKMSHGS
jgi:hypothetical protein